MIRLYRIKSNNTAGIVYEIRINSFLSDTAKGIAASVRESFEAFGGTSRLLKSSRDVYLKVNAVDLKNYCYTDPEVIRETIRYFRQCGAHKIYVIENCTQGNFTRLVYKSTGIDRICREEGHSRSVLMRWMFSRYISKSFRAL